MAAHRCFLSLYFSFIFIFTFNFTFTSISLSYSLLIYFLSLYSVELPVSIYKQNVMLHLLYHFSFSTILITHQCPTANSTTCQWTKLTRFSQRQNLSSQFLKKTQSLIFTNTQLHHPPDPPLQQQTKRPIYFSLYHISNPEMTLHLQTTCRNSPLSRRLFPTIMV